MMWIILFILMILISLGGIIYLAKGFQRFGFLKKISQKNKTAAWVISLAAVAVIGGIWLFVSTWAMMVVLIHLFIFWVISDAVFAVVAKIRGKKFKRNYSGAFALVFTAVYLGFGWYSAHKVVPTYYTIKSNNQLDRDNLRIALIADSHLGVTLDGEDFAEQIERISAENPDILIIAGDFVDDSACKADLVTACESLKNFNCEFGVYFAFGNHDKGYMQSSRDFTESDLRAELEKNNVTILEDELVALTEKIKLIGRQDKSVADRKGLYEIDCYDMSDYNIVIDHQPNSYQEETDAYTDLVLSGHTHGGHIFPAGIIDWIIGANDMVYGLDTWNYLGNDTNFIVTSGISGWAIPFKTWAKSEYVIIDVEK